MRSCLLTVGARHIATTSARAVLAERDDGVRHVNKAMQVYVEKSRRQKAFMEKESAEFENGKRHLANMMGLDFHSMGQEEIDKAIKYLFPSGLFEPRARPMMVSPEMLHPAKIVDQFDEAGRPNDHLFYTIKPAFYALMHDIAVKQAKAVDYSVHAQAALPAKIVTGGTRWVTRDELNDKLRTIVSAIMYDNFLLAIDHLASHDYAIVFSDFLMNYRTALKSGAAEGAEKHAHTSEMMTCETTGRGFVRAIGQRKRTYVTVEVFGQGTGLFTIDGLPLSAVYEHINREQCIAPLVVLDRLTHYDVVVRRDRGEGGGALAGAVRLGVSRCVSLTYMMVSDRALVPMINDRQAEMLRLAGLLSLDLRQSERKKINQPGARAKWIWKRR